MPKWISNITLSIPCNLQLSYHSQLHDCSTSVFTQGPVLRGLLSLMLCCCFLEIPNIPPFEHLFYKWSLMEQRNMCMSRGGIHTACLQFFNAVSTNSICDAPKNTEFQRTHNVWHFCRIKANMKYVCYNLN